VTAEDRFAPPRARVDDMPSPDAAGGYQPVKIWTTKGRIGRLRLLAYSVGGYIVLAIVLFVLGLVGLKSGQDAVNPLLSAAVSLVCLLPYMVMLGLLYAQRSHDMGWSGWTSLAAFIPLVGLIWVFKAGTPGANAYGNPPPPNTLGVKVLGLALPIVATLGILAAVAIPAYQQYSQRAKAAAQGLPPPPTAPAEPQAR
jgi:uncharacterized membrane protein YhaH (DUF805 family)